MKSYIILLTAFLLVSCDNKTAIKQGGTSVIQNVSKQDSIPTIDTTIVLKGIVKSNINSENLTDSIAKEVLYIHFKSKGYYNSDNLPNAEKVKDSDLSVDFNKIYLTELNGSKVEDAVITYWLTPPYVSGHCWQPHKAIILDTDKGYKIINEEFIPDNFAIDSVVTKKHKVTIFGYDYDCGNHKVLRYLRIDLK